MSESRSRRLAAYLAKRGWLIRIRPGIYSVLPTIATNSINWREDPWVVASKIFSPHYYIGGWSACEYWEFTEQIFRETVIITAIKLRKKNIEIQHFQYLVKKASKEKIFGTTNVWRDQTRVNVSDPCRTIIDLLNEPAIGGGIRQVMDVFRNYIESPRRDDKTLIDYGVRVGNRSIWKRLGYLIEAAGISATGLIEAAYKNQSKGVSLLDPSAPNRGPIVSRWNLKINSSL